MDPDVELKPVAPSSLSAPVGWEALPSLLDSVLSALQQRAEPGSLAIYRPIVETELPSALSAAVDESFAVKGRVGVGDPADVPWVGIFPPGGASAKQGVYLVYLFSYDGQRAYLALGQGTENVPGGTAVLRKRTVDLRAATGDQGGLLKEISLGSTNQRPKRYEAGTAWAKAYEAGEIPSPAELHADLKRFLGVLEQALSSGLELDPTGEPVHLLMKWSAERNPATLSDHAAVAHTKGSVWWGKFGDPSTTSMSKARRDVIRAQLDAGVETHCYLYRKGEAWRANVLAVTDDPAEVNVERLPGYYGTSECNLFVLLANLEQLAAEWPSIHLVLANNPDPAATAGALGNQTSPLFVYELFDAQDGIPAPPPESSLTMEWLVANTHWTPEALGEVITALGDRPQIILAGPPGTGKTWVAKHLARYLTNDAPLNYRVLQFHPSYGYEEFLEGLRPVAEKGAVEFRREDGAVLRIVDQMQDTTGEDHVLILDEMNRANLPRVFGELMYLLEYRGESADLLYTQDFSLPKNLLFIGTMNTADRSIRSIDIALRRRFEIIECFPDRAILEAHYAEASNDVIDLFDGFDDLNARLRELLDRHHTIGHSFFMADHMTAERLRNTWRRQLAPLLEEYFFDQPDVAATFQLEDFWPSLAAVDTTH